MTYTICQCCGDPIDSTHAHNPNVCLGCEQLLEDDSPVELAHLRTPQFERNGPAGNLPGPAREESVVHH